MAGEITFKECYVVGCGGTGGFVAEDLARILPRDRTLYLIDHDRVEDRNRERQNFYPEDVGKFKSEVLGERLAIKYQRRIGYSVMPFTNQLMANLRTDYIERLYIGCVDGAPGRIELSKACRYNQWWLDSGNGDYTGQVLIGNINSTEELKSYNERYAKEAPNKPLYLPSPALQLPALLKPLTKKEASCAENVNQSPVINRMMATLVVNTVEKILRNKLDYMGIYVDLNRNSLNPIPFYEKE